MNNVLIMGSRCGGSAPGRNVRVRAESGEGELASKGTWSLGAGERVRVETPGSGGGRLDAPPPICPTSGAGEP